MSKNKFRKDDLVDMKTPKGWEFCGRIEEINLEEFDEPCYWVRFVEVNLLDDLIIDKPIQSHRYNITPRFHGNWYKESKLRIAINPSDKSKGLEK